MIEALPVLAECPLRGQAHRNMGIVLQYDKIDTTR
jgi:hypothetical protein